MKPDIRTVRVALGSEPADLLIQNARVLDVFSGSFFDGDVAVADGIITGFAAVDAAEKVDVRGAWIIPGLIDAHVHIESSQLSPVEFARAVLPHGTTAVIADPHEIANVFGVAGIEYMLESARDLPLRVFMMAPSCVPATHLETSGAEIAAPAIARILALPGVIGLGEVMNFPGVVNADTGMMDKLSAAAGRPIDGHAPGLSGPALWAYALSGPASDHECTDLDEAREKLRAGMHILIREGTTARNLAALLPLLSPTTAPFVHFCTDDCHPETLEVDGHIDGIVAKAIAAGVPPELAVSAATIHAARAYGLDRLGAIAPGYRADIVVLSNLERMKVSKVYAAGRLVAVDGVCVAELAASEKIEDVRGSMHVNVEQLSFDIPAEPGDARVIDVIRDQVVTGGVRLAPKVEDGLVVSDPVHDILKLAVVERHSRTGNVGLGLVRGFELQRGALASSVAHDSHNIVVVGASDSDMRAAVAALVEMGGGQVVVDCGRVVASLPLPIAGLMSERPLAEVAACGRELDTAARGLGCSLPAPFMILSFLALPVIPALKLTDRGLVDVDKFEIVPLFV